MGCGVNTPSLRVYCLCIGLLLAAACQDHPETKKQAGKSAVEVLPGPATRTFQRPARESYIDTPWVKALYREAYRFRPFAHAQIEEYQEFDLQHDSAVALLRKLYAQDPKFDPTLRQLENNRSVFLRAMRQSVVRDYQQYHGLEGMNFDFLLKRDDSIARPLLLRLARDEKVSAYEKAYAREMLVKYYNQQL